MVACARAEEALFGLGRYEQSMRTIARDGRRKVTEAVAQRSLQPCDAWNNGGEEEEKRTEEVIVSVN